MIFLVIAVIAGLGAVLLVQRYRSEMISAVEEAAPKTTPVIVAALDLPIAVRLEDTHLKIVAWPREHVPEGSYSKVEELLGKTLRQGLVKGEPVLSERLANEEQGQGLAALLADGMRAMAVKVDAMVGVAGFVQPGDFVDVITTMSSDDETNKRRGEEAANISKLILQNVHVLAVGEHLSYTSASKPVNVNVVTLGVTPAEAEKLALASQYGKIQLVLRSRIDQETEETPGISPAQLLAGSAPTVTEAPERPRRAFRYPPPRRRKPPDTEQPAKPAAPTVEILRGSKVESRTLRAKAD